MLSWRFFQAPRNLEFGPDRKQKPFQHCSVIAMAITSGFAILAYFLILHTFVCRTWSEGFDWKEDDGKESWQTMRSSSSKHPLITDTTLGKVLGRKDGNVNVYLGIPFAEPPLGKLRFRPPRPKRPWYPSIHRAVRYGPECLQSELFAGTDEHQRPRDEDCLYLNIWQPANTTAVDSENRRKRGVQPPKELYPVLIWIYGGAFIHGGSTKAEYEGSQLAAKGVIVVSFNYRVGALGFLVSTADGLYGNYGLEDQKLAIQWVQDNIRHFGGDPNRVTLFGESAGAMSIVLHLLDQQHSQQQQALQAQERQQNPPLRHSRREDRRRDSSSRYSDEEFDSDDLENLHDTNRPTQPGDDFDFPGDTVEDRPQDYSFGDTELMPTLRGSNHRRGKSGQFVPQTVRTMQDVYDIIRRQQPQVVSPDSPPSSTSNYHTQVPADETSHADVRSPAQGNPPKSTRNPSSFSQSRGASPFQPTRNTDMPPPGMASSNYRPRKLFHAVIMQSNPLGYKYRSITVANFIGNAYKELLDCEDLRCLQSESPEELLHVQDTLMAVPRSIGDFFTWGPVLTDHSYYREIRLASASASPSGPRPNVAVIVSNITVRQPIDTMKELHRLDVPVIMGTNSHEGNVFVFTAFPTRMNKVIYQALVWSFFRTAAPQILKMYQPYADSLSQVSIYPDYRIVLSQIIGDYLFRCPNQFFATQLTGIGTAVYLYEFALKTRTPGFPCCDGLSCHTCELPYVFHHLDLVDAEYRFDHRHAAAPSTASATSHHATSQREDTLTSDKFHPDKDTPANQKQYHVLVDGQEAPFTSATALATSDSPSAESVAGSQTSAIDKDSIAKIDSSSLGTSSIGSQADGNLLTQAGSWLEDAIIRRMPWLQSSQRRSSSSLDSTEINEITASSDFASAAKLKEARDPNFSQKPLTPAEHSHQEASFTSSQHSSVSLEGSRDDDEYLEKSIHSLADARVSRLLAEFWTTFARFGDPNGQQSRLTADYTPGTRPSDAPWWPRLLGELSSFQALRDLQRQQAAELQDQQQRQLQRRRNNKLDRNRKDQGSRNKVSVDGLWKYRRSNEYSQRDNPYYDDSDDGHFDDYDEGLDFDEAENLTAYGDDENERHDVKNLQAFDEYDSGNFVFERHPHSPSYSPFAAPTISGSQTPASPAIVSDSNLLSESDPRFAYYGPAPTGKIALGDSSVSGDQQRSSQSPRLPAQVGSMNLFPKGVDNRMADFGSDSGFSTQRYMHQMIFDEDTTVYIIENDCICNAWNRLEYRF